MIEYPFSLWFDSCIDRYSRWHAALHTHLHLAYEQIEFLFSSSSSLIRFHPTKATSSLEGAIFVKIQWNLQTQLEIRIVESENCLEWQKTIRATTRISYASYNVVSSRSIQMRARFFWAMKANERIQDVAIKMCVNNIYVLLWDV